MKKDFQQVLNQLFGAVKTQPLQYIDVNAGLLHRKVGVYPGSDHRMPLCCYTMREYMGQKDQVIDEPESGQGARLTIRYFLPR